VSLPVLYNLLQCGWWHIASVNMFKLLTYVEECLVEDIRNYRYLTYGNVPVAGQDDEELYRQLLEAMNIMGFSKEEQLCECCFAMCVVPV